MRVHDLGGKAPRDTYWQFTIRISTTTKYTLTNTLFFTLRERFVNCFLIGFSPSFTANPNTEINRIKRSDMITFFHLHPCLSAAIHLSWSLSAPALQLPFCVHYELGWSRPLARLHLLAHRMLVLECCWPPVIHADLVRLPWLWSLLWVKGKLCQLDC